MHKHNGKILNHMKLIPYIPEDLVIQKVLLFHVFLLSLMLGMKLGSVLVLVTQCTYM